MDKRVILTFAGVVLVACALIGFKVATRKECVQPQITFEPAKPEPGQPVKFKVNYTGSDPVSWNFGDSTPDNTGLEIQHGFSSEGVYTVHARLWEGCESEIEVAVTRARMMTEINPSVRVPSLIYAGASSELADVTDEASEWNWKVVETNESGNSRTFHPVFSKPGKYAVVLSVKGTYIHGDTTFTVNVTRAPAVAPKPTPPPVVIAPRPKPEPKPEPKPKPEPAPKRSGYLSDEEFSSKFIKLSNSIADDETGEVSDQWKESIARQSCGEMKSMNVNIIKEGALITTISLEKFKRNQLASNAYSVKSVRVVKRNPQGCIQEIQVTVGN